MKNLFKKKMLFILLIGATSVLLANDNYRSKYLFAPGIGVQATLLLTSGTIDGKGESFTLGKPIVGVDTPAQNITISNVNEYAEGEITFTNSARVVNNCHIDLFLSKDAHPNYTVNPQPGDICVSVGGGDGVFGIGAPVPQPPGPPSSLFQTTKAKMVYLVDYNKQNNNLIFRGNLPFTQGATCTSTDQRVNFKKLNDIFAADFLKEVGGGEVFPKEYNLIDVDLMSKDSEGKEVQQEYASFYLDGKDNLHGYPKANTLDPNQPFDTGVAPDKGITAQMLWWTIEPDTKNLNNIVSLANKLTTIMNGEINNGKPTIIYFHCASGHDRTALAAATYLLTKYKQLNLTDAYFYGTTLGKSGVTHGAALGSRQFVPDPIDLDGDNKGKVDPDKSRLFPFAAYTNTTKAVCAVLNGKDCALDVKTDSRDPAYVLSTFPWYANF